MLYFSFLLFASPCGKRSRISYNQAHTHSSLGYLTLEEFAKAMRAEFAAELKPERPDLPGLTEGGSRPCLPIQTVPEVPEPTLLQWSASISDVRSGVGEYVTCRPSNIETLHPGRGNSKLARTAYWTLSLPVLRLLLTPNSVLDMFRTSMQ
jgi:hypothetical protein